MQPNGQDNITSGNSRRRLKRFKDFFLSVSVLAGGTLWIIYSERLPIHPSCPFKAVTHLPCPGCGGVRAVTALLHGDILQALYLNPLSVVVFLFFCIAPIWTLIDGLRGKQTLRKALTTRWNKTAIVVLVLILLANWIWNICKQL